MSKTKPMRWRKAKNPEAGGRWDTAMNHHVWFRDHGYDVELWQGGERLATVHPDGRWSARVATVTTRGGAESADEAKRDAKTWVVARRAYLAHRVTEDDAERVGLTYSVADAKARFFAWMRAAGWSVTAQAAGNLNWCHAESGSYVWLDSLVEYAASGIIAVLRGEHVPTAPHGEVSIRDGRPGLDILAEIAATEPAPGGESDRWDGGGTMIVVTS